MNTPFTAHNKIHLPRGKGVAFPLAPAASQVRHAVGKKDFDFKTQFKYDSRITHAIRNYYG